MGAMYLRLSAIILFLGVALGAFGAHGLEDKLVANGRVDTWETAVLYHLVHGIALFVLSWKGVPPKGPWLSLALGVLIFSGSLYVLSLTNITKLGAITPIGGLGFLIGWAWLAIRPFGSSQPQSRKRRSRR